MSKIELLRAVVNQHLATAAEEIFGLFVRTISEYEEELFLSKRENERQRQLLDAALKPEVQLHRTDVQTMIVKKEDQHDWRSSLDQNSPQLRHIREEVEALWSNPEGQQLPGQEEEDTVKFTFTVRSGNDAEKTELHQEDTEMSKEAEFLPTSSAEQMETEIDSSHHVSLYISASETEDSDDYLKETTNQEAGSHSQKKGSSVNRKKKEKPCTCPVCGKIFSSKGNMRTHMRRHTGEKPFTCTICSRGFSSKDNMKRHMRSHTGEKPFSCSVCNRRFGQKKDLVLHFRIHTGEKPYSCSMCNQSFVQKKTLIAHLRRHTGEKPFSCSVCGKSFNQKETLTCHSRIHTGEKPFSCSACGRKFNVLSNLKKHKCPAEHSGK